MEERGPESDERAGERTEREMAAVARLSKALKPTLGVVAAYAQVAQELGQLTGARAAVLLHHDQRRVGHLFFSYAWAREAALAAELNRALRSFHEDCTVMASRWEERVVSAVRGRLASSSCADLPVARFCRLPPLDDGRPRAGVVLIPADGTSKIESLSETFLQCAGTLLENHVEAHARTLDLTTGREHHEGVSAEVGVLQRAATLLKEATDADLVLVYSGPANEWRTIQAFPLTPGIPPLALEPGSLAAKSLRDLTPLRVLDAADPSDGLARSLDGPHRAKLTTTFGWKGLRSWVFCPVVYDGRCVGAIKVLTSDTGRFLGPHQEMLARTVADRAGVEINQVSRTHMLEELNKLASDLASLAGAELQARVLKGLLRWLPRHLRAGCEVAVIARAGDELLIHCRSDGLDEASLPTLDTLSRKLGGELAHWDAGPLPHHLAPLTVRSVRLSGVAAPFRLTGEEGLSGHLMVMSPKPFAVHEQQVVQEVARELAVLFNAERIRHEWTLSAGLFRHALLGPVQGIVSAAKLLATRATEAGCDVRHLRERVEQESTTVENWRRLQRLYLGGSIDIRTYPNDICELIVRCLDRYAGLFAARNLHVHEHFRRFERRRFPFDPDAMDIVLSNLLDNAAKYAYFNREITVGAQRSEEMVQVWVEDIGHPVPERLDELIYERGKRMDWHDPFRFIGGQGLGLAMARNIVRKHDGRIYHTSEMEGRGTVPETTPYRVRFKVELPRHWSRREGHV